MKKNTTKPMRARRTRGKGTDNPTASKDREPRAEAVVSRFPESQWRDHFAAAALIGGFREYLQAGDTWSDYDDFAGTCFSMADAMMRKRRKM